MERVFFFSSISRRIRLKLLLDSGKNFTIKCTSRSRFGFMFRWELKMLSVVSGLFILMLDPARIWENEIFF